jgi:PAS domain S-box-containing protein
VTVRIFWCRVEDRPVHPVEAGTEDTCAWAQSLFELAPEPQLVIDPFADRLLACNAAARRLLQLEAQIDDIKPSWLFSPCLPQLVVFSQAVLAKGRRWTNGLLCLAEKQRHRRVDCHAVAIAASDGPAILMSLRDSERQHRLRAVADADAFVRLGLTEWRRVEQLFREIEQDNQLILQAAGEGIYGVNADGNTTFVNPAAQRILGYTADELVGRNMHAILHHTHADGRPYAACDCPIYAAFSDGQVHEVGDEVFWHKDGHPVAVEYTSTPIREGERLVGAVVVFRDISGRKKTERQLRTALDELQALKQRLEMENAYLQQEIQEEHHYQEIVGRSAALRKTIEKIERVAPTDATVLITGESGTGKELIARAIHQSSERAERALIRVNCAAVPHELFESEFFGHVKGAFTGAVRDRAGRFELADGGTLFLDEVGEIPLQLQSKLLRVLQEGQFERVGSDRMLTTDVRVIAATNRDLEADVAAGRFREDLYFRLNVFPIHSAALRDRAEDIPILVAHFLKLIGRRFGRSDLRISEADVQRMCGYPWPGNVREMQNVLERAVITATGHQVRIELPETACPRAATCTVNEWPVSTGITTEQQRRQRDREMIIEALQASGGKVFGPGGAAEILGVKPTTLASRIKRWGIEVPK